MKKALIFLLSLMLIICAMPLTAFAAINTDTDELVLSTKNGGKLCPDVHDLINDEYQFITLLPGNNEMWRSSYDTYDLLDYDFVCCVTDKVPNFYDSAGWVGNSGTKIVYAANQSDNSWTLIGQDHWTIFQTMDNFSAGIYAANYDLLTIIQDPQYVAKPFKYFVYYRDIYGESDQDMREFSAIDYNGHKNSNIALTYLKLISHYVVVEWLGSLISFLIDQPILLFLVISGLVVSLLAALYSIYLLLIHKRKRGR